jgi:CRP-like cAMP-binding protein
LDSATRESITRNRLLLTLPARDREALLARSTLRSFRRGERIREPNERVHRLIFPETMVASLVVTMSDGRTAEVGSVGSEGLVGFQTFLDGGQMPSATICAVPGTGRAIAADAFRRDAVRSRITHSVGAFAQGLINEMAQVAACNRLHGVEQRTARWLLLTRDRVGENEFRVTQEYVAAMVGASRTSVSIAAGGFADRGIATFRHGTVRITDVNQLQSVACECYVIVRREFARLLDWHLPG